MPQGYLVRLSIDVGYVGRKAQGNPEPFALPEGVMLQAEMLAHTRPVLQNKMPFLFVFLHVASQKRAVIILWLISNLLRLFLLSCILKK